MTRVEFHPEAEAELLQSARYYEEQAPGLGQELLADVERVLGVLKAHPEIGAPAEAGTRRALTRRFPYAVVYLLDPDHILVVAVMHLHRRPRYWLHRV